MIDTAALKRLDPRSFLESVYGRTFSGTMTLCPFHDDKNPSLSFYENGEGWAWKCHGCHASGDTVAFVMRFDNVDFKVAATKFSEWARVMAVPEKPAAVKKAPSGQEKGQRVAQSLGGVGRPIRRVFCYTDEAGQELFQKVRYDQGTPKFSLRRKGADGSCIYKGALEGVRRVPYRLDKIKDAPMVIICEGERDAETLADLGFPATSAHAGKDNWPDAITPCFAGKEVAVIYDVGNDARAWAAAREVATVAKSVAVMRIPGKDPVDDREFDISDLLEPLATEEQKRDTVYKLLAAAEPVKPNPKSQAGQDPTRAIYEDPDPKPAETKTAPKPGPDPAEEKPAPMSLTLADVEPRTVPWLWLDFIPLGRATLISGDPGCAKSWLCLDLAARLSRGLPWPDGTLSAGPARTYYMTVEDDLHDTIRPRIDSLGGDPTMVTCYNPEQPLHLDLNSPEGLARLESEIVRLGDVRLVVVDPIIDFSGASNPNKTEEVRKLLTPLIKLAARHNFALVMIGHLNKAQALSAIYRAGGSTGGWLGKCRAAFMVFRDADDKPLRHVIPLKANLARQDPPQLEFRITNGRLDIQVSSEEVDIDEQLNPQHGPKPRERDDAVKWLNGLFIGRDEIPSTEVEKAAKQDGISKRTLDRAKKAAGFRSVKHTESDGQTVWVWAKDAKCL